MSRNSFVILIALILIPAAVAFANVLNHRIALKHIPGEVLVVEREDGQGLWIYHARYGSLDIKLDENGQPVEHSAAFGSMKYWDLNGDGTIDARYDGDKNAAAIWIDDAWVHVRHTKDGFQSRTKLSDDGEREYNFRNGRWAAR